MPSSSSVLAVFAMTSGQSERDPITMATSGLVACVISLTSRRDSSVTRASYLTLRQLAQDVGQDAVVIVVLHLDRRVDSGDYLEGLHRTVGRRRSYVETLARRQVRLDATNVEHLFTGQTQARDRFARQELERQDAHTDEVAAMDALKALDDDGLYAEDLRPLGGPVTRGAGAVLLAGEDDQRHTLFLVLHRGV